MARQAKSSSRWGRKLFLLLVLVALILVAAYFMKDCGLGGLGLGKGPGAGGTGTASAPASAVPSASAPASASAAADGEPYSIRVTGTGCKVGKDEASQPCDEACKAADASTQGRAKREVKLYPSAGSQEVVETLRTCLKDKGLVVLEVRD